MANKALSSTELERIYTRLEKEIGTGMALFCLCAVMDVPFDPDIEAGSWGQYSAQITASAGGEAEFASGLTDVQDAVMRDLNDEERWLFEWGEGDPDNPYTPKQYKQLDNLYRTMIGNLVKMGSLDKQQEDVARICAVWALKRAEFSAQGTKEGIDKAAKLDKMIRDNLADYNMRAKDILPSQTQRPDGFVDAVRNKLGLSVEMTKDQFLAAFYAWCRKHRYPQTVDAEEKALLAIIQTIQKNNDLPISQDLPEYAKLNDFTFEFADEPNEDEDDAYEYLGLVRG